ncbi:Probable RNA-binding protein [Scheffersomyces stipitis CBS 6054]|uniref:U1 small nuclear ribonucleoprotein component SNU71 n=1 Tax=Scheffersomyces stipitis (strain ATCC 58785 / CBS 6054 / NBRC 10063 / NRRL Y-11545) TaxID=322104 RepID=A3LZ68_PICST|nr:Probable RNA-binding protein [Scheffersomyces stipitis CBS 6054]ABN68103.2 Probable RNA-binding protein [Scheffersomyces stipitis CBS 6054]
MSYRVNEVDSEFVKKQATKDRSGTKYPKCFKVEVDVTKVNLPIIKDWITRTISEHLPDDDIVADYVYELLVANEKNPDIKGIHSQVQDFLGKEESLVFCEKLWKLLISAQDDVDGIPKEILEERKKEMEQKQKSVEVEKSRTNYNRTQSSYGESQSRERVMREREGVRGERSRERIRTDKQPSRDRNGYPEREYRDRDEYRDKDRYGARGRRRDTRDRSRSRERART